MFLSEIKNIPNSEEYIKFATQTAPKIAQGMVNEYNMKKRAWEAKNTSYQRRGSLDVSRIAYYKTSDNIFNSKVITPEGMSHGIILVCDWSGSMQDLTEPMAIQMLVTALFAKRANIPFKVTIFTSKLRIDRDEVFDKHSSAEYNKEMNELKHIVIMDDNMSERQIVEVFYHICCVLHAHSYYSWDQHITPEYRAKVLEIFSMGGTPLIEASIDTYAIAYNMKRQRNLQNVTVMFITDGEASCKGITSLVCPFTSRRFDIQGDGPKYNQTKIIHVANRMFNAAGIRTINLFIGRGRNASYIIENTHNAPDAKALANEVAQLKSNELFISDKGQMGYNKYIVAPVKVFPKLHKIDELFDADVSSDDTAKIRSQFIRGMQLNKELSIICSEVVKEMCTDLK